MLTAPKKILFLMMVIAPISIASAANLLVNADGTCQLNEKIYRCALGKNGVASFKREGDLKTPAGKFPLRWVYYRPDKFPQGIETQLPQKPLAFDMGWCDDLTSSFYNQPVQLPFPKRHETLWRNDDIYDLIVVIGYNDDPIESDRGSAVFIHVARNNYSPTYGCVAFSKKDLLEILKELDKQSFVIIQ
jgi:L,D-peptidoglycan transpeptidase YkuD (ErfK/YbiS/YcfS/YnhG family)